uniref:Uncharacterized protein n=1 Tax=Panagrolaimus sp. ES5 TaxID=591445 RepID=A0AC34FF43_9BILA
MMNTMMGFCLFLALLVQPSLQSPYHQDAMSMIPKIRQSDVASDNRESSPGHLQKRLKRNDLKDFYDKLEKSFKQHLPEIITGAIQSSKH